MHGSMDRAPWLVSLLSFHLSATTNSCAYVPDAVVDQPLFFHHPATAYSVLPRHVVHIEHATQPAFASSRSICHGQCTLSVCPLVPSWLCP